MKRGITDVNDICDIVSLNRDVEPLVIQASATRTRFFREIAEDRFRPLRFVHFSDIHAVPELWDRIVDFINYYSDYVDFAIHTGDYCGSCQEEYVDFYGTGKPCARSIYNCVGNHDTVTTPDWIKNTKESAHKLLFEPCNCKDELTFLECDYSMTYYRDFPESNIRLVVLDMYFDIDIQCAWLRDILRDAREKGLCVITAMHERTDFVNDSFGVTFHTRNDYLSLEGRRDRSPFEEIIVDFIADGGCHICNLAGHEHHDLFGMTDAGVLNIAVQSGTCWDGWCDGLRVRGTRTDVCFMYMGVDVKMGLLKIVRVGNNRDIFLRSQRSLCYDYLNRKIIFND